LVLEDSINGGKAARAAGIRYIIVPDINPPTEEVIESALAVVDTLHEVVELISS
jgi:beta-phosphoglucomutase-like phosphatase (HAD superfamily)